jgi:AraC-like DNA-binding protein
MLMVPVPVFAAVILAWLSLRTVLAGGRRLLALFLMVVALQSLGLALVRAYGVVGLQPVLPVTAATIPPLAWITFRAALFRLPALRDAALHLLAPLFVLFCRIFAPGTIDAVVALVFAGYGGAILWHLRAAGDLPLARLEAGGLPALLWRGLGWALIASAAGDLLIAVAFMTGNADWAVLLMGLFPAAMLLALGVLSTTGAATGDAEEVPEGPAKPAPDTTEEDSEILSRLDACLLREKLHLDPGLTLARLARRLHLPEKRLSAAVNRAAGDNVSRYINGWRIRHACGLIAGGASITSAMLDSGFNTKSNFNREFHRVTGSAPSTWRQG